MPQPTGLAYGLAVVMVGVCLYCVARLVVAWRWDRPIHVDVNVAHVAMGLAMAGMLAPRLDTLPTSAWEGVFGALALWFVWQSGRTLRLHGGAHPLSHYVVHLVMSLAMIYMYGAGATIARPGPVSAMAPPTGTGADFVALPLVFVVVLLASALWQLDAVSTYARSSRPLVRVVATATPETVPIIEDDATSAQWLAPRLEMGCHIATCITMAYVLVLVL